MGGIEVKSITISELLTNLSNNTYLVPKFQREFVWTENDVIKLATSVIEQKPIGMITLWEQQFGSELPKENLSIPDRKNNKNIEIQFSTEDTEQATFYVILDGKQRSTSLAMAFAWLRASNGSFNHSGRYFLDVKEENTSNQVKYLKHKECQKLQLNGVEQYVSHGLFPLELDKDNSYQASMKTWLGHLQRINDEKDYPTGEFPGEEEIEKRSQRFEAAYQGVIHTRLAVYIVPRSASLGQICEIFDTLNQTGTKVSTLDLIHSWVYQDTSEKRGKTNAVNVRGGIEAIGELDGAEGWFVAPRLDVGAQMLACIQVALDKPSSIRTVPGEVSNRKIDSIKAKDLLALSSDTWRKFFTEKKKVVEFLKSFQYCVADGRFTRSQCPYPGVALIYIALKWHMEFEKNNDRNWGAEHLDSLFKAFFWRNTFSRRYDQGSMTKNTRDINDLKNILYRCKKNQTVKDWAVIANEELGNMPDMLNLTSLREDLPKFCENHENYKGALRQGLLLLLYTLAKKDFIDPSIDISNLFNNPQIHHIIPKKWWNKNFAEMKFTKSDAETWKESVANLIPISAKTNKEWGDLSPITAFEELEIGKNSEQIEMLRRYLVDKHAQELLEKGLQGIPEFLKYRANFISEMFKTKLEVS